jgi:hypothetical protein
MASSEIESRELKNPGDLPGSKGALTYPRTLDVTTSGNRGAVQGFAPPGTAAD